MYAVIRRYQFDKQKSDQINHNLQEVFVPLLKEASGFVAYYWLDTGEGTGASLSVFKDKAGADESVRSAASFVKQHLAGVITNKPEIIQGKVGAHG